MGCHHFRQEYWDLLYISVVPRGPIHILRSDGDCRPNELNPHDPTVESRLLQGQHDARTVVFDSRNRMCRFSVRASRGRLSGASRPSGTALWLATFKTLTFNVKHGGGYSRTFANELAATRWW